MAEVLGYGSRLKANFSASFCCSEKRILCFLAGDGDDDSEAPGPDCICPQGLGLPSTEPSSLLDALSPSSELVLLDAFELGAASPADGKPRSRRRLPASRRSVFRRWMCSMLRGSLNQSCIRMKGSRPLMLSMCHGFGLDSNSETEPCDRPSTASPNIYVIMNQ